MKIVLKKEMTIPQTARKCSPPAPSPRTKSREDRIADIVAAALEEFSERGFERTRMEDIAARAHISKGTVYLYFKSKEDVFEGMVRHFILPNVEKAEQLSLLQDMSAEDQLKLFMKIGYTQITKPTTRKITRLIIAEGLRFPHLIEFYYENAIKRAKTAMSFILEQGRQKGEFRDLGAPLCPQVIVGPILLGSLWKLLFEDLEPLDLDKLYNQHIDIMMSGLKPLQPTEEEQDLKGSDR